jgi:hypothetical protein
MGTPSKRGRVSTTVRILGATGLASAFAIAGFGDRATTSLVNGHPKGRSGDLSPIYRAAPSPDGRWVAIDRLANAPGDSRVTLVEVETGELARASLCGECVGIAWSEEGLLRVRSTGDHQGVDWIDPRTGARVRTSPDRDWEAQGFSRHGDGWSKQETVKTSDGIKQRFEWRERGLTASIPLGAQVRWSTTPTPGVVFHSRREGEQAVILRTELDGAAEREIARVPTHAGWLASPDALRIAVSTPEGVRVVDAVEGKELGQLPGQHVASWVGGSRWLAINQDFHVVLHDLEQSSSRRLFATTRPDMGVHALPGERILAQCGEQVLLFEKDSATGRRLYPPDEHARR